MNSSVQEALYTRLYTDADGETHFEDVTVALSPTEFAPPAEPLNTASFLPADGTIWVGAPTDWGGDTPHPSPQRQIFCTAQGEYEITASDGSKRTFPPGSVLLLEDTWGAGHSTRIVTRCVVFGVALRDQQA
ncbi:MULTISPECIES: cupin domain-containing protein [Haloferax]|uniref:Cupin domain-containing protein n=1 Tax=Haloferax marinum TaxID=2666143 RepID=A0A6A8G5I2_9EURY|nr:MULTISPECIES: cupin domain-containing protein [Haloferax]KAB1197002.1 cupin domain-containing protein [Haloferax sp. CBA1150]MRW96025.1 cupin domain-containing protein [Haloferax marinum]